MLRTFAIVSLAAGGVLATFNQETSKPTGQTTSTSRQDRSAQDKNASATTDGYLAKWISVGHSNVIELSRLAESRATDPEVKRFATKMVADHQGLTQKLAPFVKLQGRSSAIEAGSPTDRGRQGDRDPSDRNPADRPQGERAPSDMNARGDGELNHAALFEELGQQCLQSSRKELEGKQGAEFDRCYVGMMLVSHKIDNDALIVFQRHATPDLKPVLAEAQSKTEGHMSTAKDFAQRMERKALGSLKGEPSFEDRKLDGSK
jgi:predicted outer membrane protein